MPQEQSAEPKKSQGRYTIQDAMQVADDILNLSKEKKYSTGAFVHGQIFALEFATAAYGIPTQQIAEIKRDCRKYINEIIQLQAQARAEPHVHEAPEQKSEQKQEKKTEQKT
jgi:hypothetical protein